MLSDEILINKYGQELLSIDPLVEKFTALDVNDRSIIMNEIINLIIQSKPKGEDIIYAISDSKLKPTYTPCVLLKKGVTYNNLLRIVSLPEHEFRKSLILLLNLFKIAYQRRFKKEKNNPVKWWY